jgi:hypothetical protein
MKGILTLTILIVSLGLPGPELDGPPHLSGYQTSLFVLPTSGAPGETRSQYRYRDLMPTYWSYVGPVTSAGHRATVDGFRTRVIEPNRKVFSAVAGPWLNDTNLPRFIEALEGKSGQMHLVEEQFPRRLDETWHRFTKVVPDLSARASVYLLPAPRVAVGGSVRPLGNENAIIFGAEEISTVIESQTAFDVLVHHEMTHLYHMQVNPEIKQMIAAVYMPPYATDRAKLYQVLWLEGLAAYMSRALNPTATDNQVLLSDTVAADVKSVWPRIGSDIGALLDSSKKVDIDAYLFDSDTSGRIPRRAGYYIGMKVAEELAKKYPFGELCRLFGAQLRSEVGQALRVLESAGPQLQ